MDENELMGYLGVEAGDGARSALDTAESPDTGTNAGEPPESGGEGAAEKPAADNGGSTAAPGDGERGTPEERTGTARPQARIPGQTPGTGGYWPGAAPGSTGRSGAVDAEAYLDEAIRALGITDPYSGKAITSRAAYDAYRNRMSDERKGQILTRAGLSEEEFKEFVENLPEVRKAREDSRRAQELIRRQRETEARARVDAEIAKITAMDPSVKSLADLTAQENYQELYGYVKRGYDISDAWRLANFDKLRQQSAEASRQAAYNAQSGRAGMTATKPSGQGNDTVPVPADVLELYRGLMPGVSDEEIRRHYNKNLKK